MPNQSGEKDSDHCSSLSPHSLSTTVPQSFKLSAFHSCTGFNVGFGVFLVSICWIFFEGGLLLRLPHPLDDKAWSPSDEDVLFLWRGVHDCRHQQLPERLPRLDQQVVGPAREQESQTRKAACYCLMITLMESNYLSDLKQGWS